MNLGEGEPHFVIFAFYNFLGKYNPTIGINVLI